MNDLEKQQPELDFCSPYPDGLPGHRRRDTEILAAALVRDPEGARARVFRFVRSRGDEGATYCEIVDHFDDTSMHRRLSDLTVKGLLADSGRRRPSHRGRPCIVWVVGRDVPELPEPDEC